MNNPDATTVTLKMSVPLKTHVATHAHESGMGMSEFIRKCVAQATGYNLAADNILTAGGRQPKYHSEEERKAAHREQARKRAAHHKKVVAAVARLQRERGIEALTKYLEAHGVSLDDSDVQDSRQSA